MTYKINIKQDYNAKIRLGRQPVSAKFYKVAGAILLFAAPLTFYKYQGHFTGDAGGTYVSVDESRQQLPTAEQEVVISESITESTITPDVEYYDGVIPAASMQNQSAEHFVSTGFRESLSPTSTHIETTSTALEPEQVIVQEQVNEDAGSIVQEPNESIETIEVIVKSGESLALIFKRLNISATTLHNLMLADKQVNRLKRIKPGETLKFDFLDGKFSSLSYSTSVSSTLKIDNDDGDFQVHTIDKDIQIVERLAEGTITSSLYMAGKHSRISDKLIMELVGIYGWDIDFSQDIRKGDRFKILFEEKYIEGKKIGDGKILAAEFVNRGESLKALYFKDKDSVLSGYYSDSGHSMKKAFLRMPVDFARISSRFNLKRKHPVLNTIRAHKGVDYAAATGTPIKASGDGIVQFKGRKGGYGRTIILKHGGSYTTLYAHMSRYSKKVHTGQRVKQGDVIGYIGKSGLATGPHLHYEFRVNGVHRNPLTVKLPKALSIPEEKMAEFQQYTANWLAQIDSQNPTQMASNSANSNNEVVAMTETITSNTKTQ